MELGMRYKFRRARIGKHHVQASVTQPENSRLIQESSIEANVDRSATCQASSPRQELAVEASDHAGLDSSSTRTDFQMDGAYLNNMAINVPLELHYRQNCTPTGWPQGTFADQNSRTSSHETWFLPEAQGMALETNFQQDW